MHEKVREAQGLVEDAKRIGALPALLHAFIEHAAEAVVIVDKAGLIQLFNRRASFLFGYLPSEVIGQPVEVLLPSALRERHVAHRSGFMGDPYTRAMGSNLDLQAQHKDGSTFPVLIDLHPEMSADGPYVRAAIRRKPAPG